MNLAALRAEVMSKGFDPTLFPSSRVNQYINDGLSLIARRVDYYGDEAALFYDTIAGQSGVAYPGSFARTRSIYDQDRAIDLQAVSERDIERSAVTQGAPLYYASYRAGWGLYPTPDAVYHLVVRFWQMPPTLSADGDVPSLPVDWHHILWVYATWMCYESEDDTSMGQYWQQRFATELAEFAADQKFPSTDFPTQAISMWDQDKGLGTSGWSLYGGGV